LTLAPSDHFLGDTLLLPPPTPLNSTVNVIIATSRGFSTATRGWLSVFLPDSDGTFVDADIDKKNYWDVGVHHSRTPTSGGKANAIAILPTLSNDTAESSLWILLTDDDGVTAPTV
jgi:carboxy-cis,cis-muconate cyclase